MGFATPTVARDKRLAPYTQIFVSGEDAAEGTFDPSIDYDGKVAGTGWMSYSGVDRTDSSRNVWTNIAKTTDYGLTWVRQAEDVNDAHTPAHDGGHYKNEVSNLRYNPSTDSWIMISHRMFVDSGGTQDPTDSYITWQTGATPTSLSVETKMFDSGNNSANFDLTTFDASLSTAATFTEPGMLIEDDGTIYIAIKAKIDPDLGFLLKSTDNGTTWSYVAQLVDDNDASSYGYTGFGAVNLFKKGTKRYFTVVYRNLPSPPGIRDDGCIVVEFEDISTGTLKTKPNGLFNVEKRIPLQAPYSWGGHIAWHEENTAGGIIMPMYHTNDTNGKVFNFFNTGIML